MRPSRFAFLLGVAIAGATVLIGGWEGRAAIPAWLGIKKDAIGLSCKEWCKECEDAVASMRGVEVVATPRTKLKIYPPLGWTVFSESAGMARIESREHLGAEHPGVDLTFPADLQAKLTTQTAVDDAVRIEEVKRLEFLMTPIVEMKSSSGMGAYCVVESRVPVTWWDGTKTTDAKLMSSVFVTHGLVIKFSVLDNPKGTNLPLAVKLIEQGIRVE